MIKLIKNEIYKILHKKSTYIIMIITALFMVLVSYVYSKDNNFYNNPYYPSEGDVIDKKIAQDMNSYYEKYDRSTWQYYKLDEYYSIAYNYYNAVENGEDSSILKKEYDDFKNALEQDNWKFFVTRDLNEATEELKNFEANKNIVKDREKDEIENQIFATKVKIELLEYRLKENVAYGEDYLNEAINVVENTAYSVSAYEKAKIDKKSEYEEAVKNYYENRYILETKEDTNNANDLRCIIMNFFQEYMFMIIVFGVMVAGAIVSDEYNKGTIKSLLITPYKRSTILLSKFITSILLTIIFIVFAYLMQIVIGGLFLGFDSLKNHVVVYNLATKSLEIMSLLKYVVIITICYLPQILLLVTLAFAVSTIIGNTAFAIAITFAGSIGASLINMFAIVYKVKILKYFVTTNWDFTLYLFGKTSQYGTSLTHAIIVCLIYFLIMVVISFIVFKRKNIKNI